MIIYKLIFPNSKIYIGQTVQTMKRRIRKHKWDAFNNTDITKYNPTGSKIGSAIRKYKDFTYEIIEEVNDLNLLNDLEEYWVDKLDTINEGYNIKPGGGNRKHNESTKKKVGQATKDRWKNPEIREKMLEGQRKTVEVAKKTKGIKKVQRQRIVCENCGIEFEALPGRHRNCCSQQCAAELASKKAGELKIKQNQLLNQEIEKNLLYWVKNNSRVILDCPMNKINSLNEIFYKITGISDMRLLAERLVGNRSKKELLLKLKNYAKIYAELDQN
jgi:hypothetical protein